MCGITGLVAFSPIGEIKLNKLEDSVKALQKRGPDGNGVFKEKNIGLGHARLSIIDVSNNAAQPFTDASGRYTIVFNGEFFNFKEHKRELEKQGFVFRSSSDTEVLLELYIREGVECLHKVNGFFAIAIHDRSDDSIFIARDRFGVKPLLIFQDPDCLIFASEMKAIMAYDIDKSLNYEALYEYLHLNYIPAPETIFRKVRKLLPGHSIFIKNSKVEENTWYNLPSTTETPVPSYLNAQNTLQSKMDEAVERRLVSDVPLGAFLSGGIDSSVVVALASKHTKHLSTFSIGYKDEPLFDETKYAKLVANKFQTNHTVFSLTNKDLFNHLQEVLEYIDEPFADSSALAVYILSKETRKHVTVALSGDGADEIFGGYMKHHGEWVLRNGGFKSQVVKMLGPVWNVLPASRNSTFGNLVRKLRKFNDGLSQSNADRYWQWCGYADEDYLKDLISFKYDGEKTKNLKAYHTRNIGKENNMNDVLRSDVNLVLPGDMLTKVDLMSMANSLEVRSPFMDVNVVDFAFKLPPDYKINGQGRKRIVQDTFRNILPPELYNRPKHGFEVPLLKWFQQELNSWIFDDLLNDEHLKDQGLFTTESIKNLKLQLNSSNPGDAVARIWGLIVFQQWYFKWIK
jgi:asparagine synthase (glutamine-hydrolysing)